MANRSAGGKWQADALNCLIKEDRYDIIFSHFHNVAPEGPMIVKFLRKGHNDMTLERCQEIFREGYQQTDMSLFLKEILYRFALILIRCVRQCFFLGGSFLPDIGFLLLSFLNGEAYNSSKKIFSANCFTE